MNARPIFAATGLGIVALIALIGLGQWYLRRTAVGPQVIEINAKDIYFEPRQFTVRSGGVTIILTNQGRDQHNLVLSGLDGKDIDGIPTPTTFLIPGTSSKKTFTLASGDYTFYCSRDSHYQLGMTGSLLVK